MRVSYKDGAYHNFPALEKNADGVYFIQAMGFSLRQYILTKKNAHTILQSYERFFFVFYLSFFLFENQL